MWNVVFSQRTASPPPLLFSSLLPSCLLLSAPTHSSPPCTRVHLSILPPNHLLSPLSPPPSSAGPLSSSALRYTHLPSMPFSSYPVIVTLWGGGGGVSTTGYVLNKLLRIHAMHCWESAPFFFLTSVFCFVFIALHIVCFMCSDVQHFLKMD